MDHRPPKRKPQGEVRKQNKSDSSILHGVGSHNESSNSTDGSALENSFPQILEHIMNDPLLPHKLAENINKSLHPEVIPDPGTPATLPPVDVVPESPFMGRSLEDILDQQETQMPASSINGIIELTEKDPNFEWLFSAGVCYLDEATHDRDFLEKSRSNGLQSSTKASSQHPQPGSSGCKDSVPVSSMLFGEVTSDNIHFTPPTSFIPDDNENNLFNPALPMSMPNFSKTPTSHAESFQSLSQFTKTREAVSAPLFQVTECGTMLHHTGTSSVSVPVTNSYTASQTLGTSAVQSVTMCVTAQPLETAVTSHQPITSRTSSQPITTAVTSIQPITSSFSSECGKETVETTLTSPHGFPVLSLRSSINDDDLPDPLASFTIQSPVKPCVASQSEAKEGTSVASASYTSFVSGMGNGQHSSTPIMARSNTLILPCITSSAEPTNNTSAGPSSSQMGFVKPHSTTSPKSLPTVNLQCLMQKLEAKAKGEIVELDDLQPKPPPKPSSKSRGRKKNPPAKKTSPKRVQPKPLNPSGAAKWSSELSALVKITSPEKSTPQATKRSNTKKTRVTRSSAAQISNLDTNQTAPQSSSKKTKKGNETVMAVLSPSGGSVHHLPVLEVNSLSEVADAKDLVPMGQLIPTTLPVTSSHTSMVTTQSSMTSQPQCFSSKSSSLLSMPLPEHISSRSPENILSTTKITITSSSSPFVQTDAPQTPPTSSCYTEYPSMPELCGTLPSLPVPATICDKSKDKKPDHATVLSDIYSADRDFLESPHSDIDNSDNHKEDKLTQAGVASVTDDLNRYCGIPIDKLTQRDVHLRPLDFGSSIPQTSQAEVSSPIRQPSFGRGKRTPATNKKKKIGRPPTRRSTRGKSQPTADDEIMNSPTTSKDSTHGQPQTLTRTGPLHERFESGTNSAEGITSQHISDISQQGKASQGNFFVTPSRKGKMSVPVAPSQVRSPYHEPVCTPHQDIGYSPASTPDRLTICTPTSTDDLPSKGDTPRQVLTLGNVGALSLQEVVNSPTYHDDATSRDSVISHHASSPSLRHIEQNRARQIDSNGKSDSKVKDKNGTVYRGEEMETQIPHSENENIAESEISSAVMSLQDEAVSEGMRDTPNPDALELLPYSSGQGFEHTINTDFQQLPTVTKDNNNWSVPKDTIDRQQSDVSVQSVTNPIREQNAIPSEMPQNRRYSDAILESVTSDVNTCTVVSNSDTINHSHPINQSHDTQKPQQNVNQPQSHGVNHLQQEVINQSQDHVVNQSQSYDINHSHGPVVNQSQGQFTNQSEENQNTTSQSRTTSSDILREAMQDVFSNLDSQQAFFSPAPLSTETQAIPNSSANQQPFRGPISQGLGSSTAVVSQTQFIVYSPLSTQPVLSTAASTMTVRSSAPVLTNSKFIVHSPAPVVSPAPFVVKSPTYQAVVNSPGPLPSHSQLVLNSPVTPLMVKSPATPLIVNSPATPQVAHSPATVMASASYKSVCSPAQQKRAPTPQMEPADFIPDRSGTIYVTPNVLAQMSCEKGLVVQQERPVTTSSIVQSAAGSVVDNCGVAVRPDVVQSPRRQYQSDQDIFAETTDEEVVEPTPVLPTPTKMATITEVSHDIAKIPSLFDTKDGHNEVVTESGNVSPHHSKGSHSPRYFSALSNSNDTHECGQTSTREAYPGSPTSEDIQRHSDPGVSALPDPTGQVPAPSDSDDDIDVLGDWDHDLSAEELKASSLTEHTISHNTSTVSSDSCSPSKKSAWQAGFATKPSSTTSAFIRKILEHKNTRQTSEKKSPASAEKVSLKTQTASQKISPVSQKKSPILTQGSSVTQSTQSKVASSGDQQSKGKAPRRVQVITLSKEVSRVSKDSHNAVQSARGPFKHPQELTPRKSSHSSGKLISHVKHSVSNVKTSSGGNSTEKDASSHQQYVTPPKKRFTASLKSGEGLYFTSGTQGSETMNNHSQQIHSQNSSSKVPLIGQSPHRSRKSALVPREDIDTIHTLGTQDNKLSDNYYGRISSSPSRASEDQRSSHRTSRSPAHSNKISQSPSCHKTSEVTSQSHINHNSSERSSQKTHHKKSVRKSQSPSSHRTVHDKTLESPSRVPSENLERVNASPNIRRKVFETKRDIERNICNSEDSNSRTYKDHDPTKSGERGHSSSSVGRPSSSSSYHRMTETGKSNTDTTRGQPSPTLKRGHKRREDSQVGGEVKAKRAKKSNKSIDLTKLDVDRFLNSDLYIKGILEK
ncbi:uncharacterized protein [Argopecten irradians]|uniref:uncharacterized protein n=1 Tax=Argopecten irradians TaxID=31199 RepID=UPI00371685BC